MCCSYNFETAERSEGSSLQLLVLLHWYFSGQEKRRRQGCDGSDNALHEIEVVDGIPCHQATAMLTHLLSGRTIARVPGAKNPLETEFLPSD